MSAERVTEPCGCVREWWDAAGTRGLLWPCAEHEMPKPEHVQQGPAIPADVFWREVRAKIAERRAKEAT